MRSADSAALPRSCVAMTTVLAGAFHSASTSSSQTWLRGSSALVGSSMSSTSGSHREHAGDGDALLLAAGQRVGRAVEQLRRCAAASATSATRSRTSASVRPSCSGPKASSSKTLEQNSCTSASWKTKPTRLRNSRRNAGLLERVLGERRGRTRRSCLPSGKTSPSSILSSVDLPLPFAPTMATCSPAVDGQVDAAQSADARAVLVPDAGEATYSRSRGHRGITTLSAPSQRRRTRGRMPASHSPVARGRPEADERRHRAREASREHRVVDVVGGLDRLARDERHALDDPPAVLRGRAGREHAALAREVDVLDRAQQRDDLLLRHRERGDDEVGNAQRGERVQQVGPARRPHDEQPDAGAGDDARDESRGDVAGPAR